MSDIIALIPARGGSKGVPRKNLRPLRGKPLIAYSIVEALKSERIDVVFVSTEDGEISRVSEELGAEVIERPARLAQDETPTLDVVLQALEELETVGRSVRCVVLLQPTSPLRKARDIDEAITLFLAEDCDSVVSVCKSNHPPQWMLTIEDGYLKPLFGETSLNLRRQSLPETYAPNGAIFVSTPSDLRANQSFYTPRSLPYLMPAERSVDIDTYFDLRVAELALNESHHGGSG